MAEHKTVRCVEGGGSKPVLAGDELQMGVVEGWEPGIGTASGASCATHHDRSLMFPLVGPDNLLLLGHLAQSELCNSLKG